MILEPDKKPSLVRPKLLTILCTLTFISCVAGLWNQAERFWNPAYFATSLTNGMERLEEVIRKRAVTKEELEAYKKILTAIIQDATPKNIQKSALIIIGYEILTLFGAFQMWNLRKRGFYLYVAGIVLAPVAAYIFIGGFFGLAMVLGSIMISAIFALIYAANLKYMY